MTRNYFHDNGGTGGLVSFDGAEPGTIVANNVFVCTCEYPWSVAAYGSRDWVVRHNTFVNGGSLRFQTGNEGSIATGNVVRDNLWVGGGEISTTTDGYGTNDHNLNSGRAGTGNLTGTPVFIGGRNPITYAGFRLAAGSPGKHAASDGKDIGIR